jgi:predicted RNase H-like nuclease
VVAGVTPCPSGWLVASAKLQGATFAPEEPRVFSVFTEVLDERPSFSVVTINAPIGNLDQAVPGGRSCDRLARSLLGRRRGSTVHSAPTMVTLASGTELADGGLDAVTRKLLPRYREVAADMAPYLQRTVYEAHPELSFYQVNNEVPLIWPKKTEAGRAERTVLLRRRIPGVARVLDASIKGVPASHLLDAAVLMWTARRVAARAAMRLPKDPEWDSQGLRMELVY